jgi:ComF family protein
MPLFPHLQRSASGPPFEPALPSQCEFCRRWGPGTWCDDCGARFAPPRPRCQRCALPVGVASARCGGCLGEEPAYAASVVAVDYDFPWDRLVAAFKFQGRVELAGAMGLALAAAVERTTLPRPALVLPVPLAPARLAERGYNQAWALAQSTARALGLPAQGHWLQRPADTAHQTGLTRAARQANLARAFMVDPTRRPALAGQTVALVDDVMTTGATLAAAAAELRRAGAAAVQAWVFARTPAPRS